MVGLFSENKKCTRTEFGCGTSFAKRCSGMVRAQVDVVRQEHSAGFARGFFQCCCHSRYLFCSRSPQTIPRGCAKVRKLLRRMIPPPVGIDWSAPWHVILHSWHARKDTAVHQFAFLPWSAVVTIKYWKFAAYIKNVASAKMVATLFGLDATQQQAMWPTSFCLGWEGMCFFPLETGR